MDWGEVVVFVENDANYQQVSFKFNLISRNSLAINLFDWFPMILFIYL